MKQDLTYRLLADLLNLLQAQGFHLGVRKHLQVQELLKKLPPDIEPQALKTLLCPLFATNNQEQSRFYELFDQSWARISLAEDSETAKKTSVDEVSKWRNIIYLLLIGLVFFIGMLFIMWLFPETPVKGKRQIAYVQAIRGDTISQTIQIRQDTPLQQISFLDGQQFGVDSIFGEYFIDSSHQLIYIARDTIGRNLDTVGVQAVYLLEVDSLVLTDSILYIVSISEPFVPPTPPPADLLTPQELPFPQNITDLQVDNKALARAAFYSENAWWIKPLLMLLLGAIFWATMRWRQKKRQKLVAEIESREQAPYVWNLDLDSPTAIGWEEELLLTTQRLRRRTREDQFQFDAPRTVQATVRNAGLINVQYRQQTRPPEYLMLIDRKAGNDHLAQLFDQLFLTFKANEVHIERYFFDGDPRLCFNESYTYGISLKELQQRFTEARLLIVSVSYQLLSPLSGKLAKWTTLFQGWKDRAILTTQPLSNWGKKEEALAKAFEVLPASMDGLQLCIERFEQTEPSAQPFSKLRSGKPEQYQTIQFEGDLIRTLKKYYSPGMLEWVAACAVYPSLHWDLTIYLGNLLSTDDHQLTTTQNLFQLNRLPWFVEGKMPEAVRRALLEYLPDELESRVRISLSQVFKESPKPDPNSVAYDDYRMNLILNEMLITEDEALRRQLEKEYANYLTAGHQPDFAVVKYLEREQSSLDFLLPEDLQEQVKNKRKASKSSAGRIEKWDWLRVAAVFPLLFGIVLSYYQGYYFTSTFLWTITILCLFGPIFKRKTEKQGTDRKQGISPWSWIRLLGSLLFGFAFAFISFQNAFYLSTILLFLVMVAFLWNPVKEIWKKMVRPSWRLWKNSLDYSRLGDWTWAVPLWLLCSGFIVWFSPSFTICEGEEVTYNNLRLCIDSDEDRLLYYEYLVKDFIGQGEYIQVDSINLFASVVRSQFRTDQISRQFITYPDQQPLDTSNPLDSMIKAIRMLPYRPIEDSLLNSFRNGYLEQIIQLKDTFFVYKEGGLLLPDSLHLAGDKYYRNQAVYWYNRGLDFYNQTVDSTQQNTIDADSLKNLALFHFLKALICDQNNLGIFNAVLLCLDQPIQRDSITTPDPIRNPIDSLPLNPISPSISIPSGEVDVIRDFSARLRDMEPLGYYYFDVIDASYIQKVQQLTGESFTSKTNLDQQIQAASQATTTSGREKYQKLCLLKGLSLLQTNQVREAQKQLEESLNFSVGTISQALSIYWLGAIAQDLRNYNESIRLLNQFLNLAKDLSNLPDESSLFTANYLQGYNYLKLENYAAAASFFSETIDGIKRNRSFINSNYVKNDILEDATLRAGDCYFKRNQYSQAITYYDETINNQYTGYVYAMYQKAIVEGLRGRATEKILLLDRIANDFPNSEFADDALLQLGITYQDIGQFSIAIGPLQQLATDYQNSSELVNQALLNLGFITYEQGNVAGAINYYKQVFSNNPTADEARQALDAIRTIYIDVLADADAFFAFLESIPGYRLEIFVKDSLTFEAGASQFEQKLYERAIQALTKYIRAFPNGSYILNAYSHRAESYEAMNRPLDALADYRYIFDQGPSPYYQSAKEKVDAARTGGTGEDITYQTFRLGQIIWFSENLNESITNSWCYNDALNNCNLYGRLYTWDAAKKACESLGDGWRLPTDQEWRDLANNFGGYSYSDTVEGDPQKAYNAMIEGGTSAFQAKLAGRRMGDGSYNRLGSYAYYWSSTASGAEAVRFYLDQSTRNVDRGHDDVNRAYSCRCVKDQ